jgi:hypothetical protein
VVAKFTVDLDHALAPERIPLVTVGTVRTGMTFRSTSQMRTTKDFAKRLAETGSAGRPGGDGSQAQILASPRLRGDALVSFPPAKLEGRPAVEMRVFVTRTRRDGQYPAGSLPHDPVFVFFGRAHERGGAIMERQDVVSERAPC